VVDELPGDPVAGRYLDLLAGRWEEASRAFAEAADADEGRGDHNDAAVNHRGAAWAMRLLGDHDGALAALGRALATGVSGPQVPTEVAARAEVARITATDDPEGAARQLQRCEEAMAGEDWRGLAGTVDLAERGMVAGGSRKNHSFLRDKVDWGELPGPEQIVLADAHHLIDAEQSIGLQHPPYFLEQPGLVRNIHADMDQHRGIERPSVERQIERAAVTEGDEIGQAAAARQLRRHLHELLGQVDAGDAAFVRFGEVARRPADAAADIQHMHAGRKAEILGQRSGYRQPSEVELVPGGQIHGC